MWSWSMRARPLLLFLVILHSLSLVLAAPTGLVDGDAQPDQPTEDPSSDSSPSDQNAVSWQSAFWALAAIVVSVATQPSGRILGMPPEWGFALKLSPVLCLANAAEALSCIRMRRWAVTVRPGKYETADDVPVVQQHSPPAHQGGMSALQYNTVLRITLFVLGPVLQAVKLFACSGIVWTQLLAASYLASFVCDEVVLTLLWLTGSDPSRDDGVASALVKGIMGLFLKNGNGAPDADNTPRPQDPRGMLAASAPREQHLQPENSLATPAVVTACIFIALFIGSILFAMDAVEPNLRSSVEVIVTLSLPFVIGLYMATRPRVEPPTTSLMSRLLLGFVSVIIKTCFFLFVVTCVDSGLGWGKETIVRNSLGRLEAFHLKTAKGVLGTINVLYIYFGIEMAVKRFLDLWNAANAVSRAASAVGENGSDDNAWRLSSARPEPHRLWWNFPAGWCIIHFLTGLFFYCIFFGAHETFQPSWTRVLG